MNFGQLRYWFCFEKIKITENSTLKAFAKRGDKHSRIFKRDFVFNKATGNRVEMGTNPAEKYTFNGASVLTDGVRGDFNYSTGCWLGYLDDALEVELDLKETTTISSVKVGVMIQIGEWVFPPTKIVVWTSNGDEPFVLQSSKEIPVAPSDIVDGLAEYGCEFNPVEASKVKVIVETTSSMPDWHGAKGEPSYMFVDEIVID